MRLRIAVEQQQPRTASALAVVDIHALGRARSGLEAFEHAASKPGLPTLRNDRAAR
jgi:hypothetical protein